MPIDDRDYVRGKHPPTCTCTECVNKRLGGVRRRFGIPWGKKASLKPIETKTTSDKGVGDEKEQKRSSFRVPNWLLAILCIFASCFVGLGLSVFIKSFTPLWLMLGFSVIYCIEKWLYFVLSRRKHSWLGKLYRLFLNSALLSLLGFIIWSGIRLFSQQFIYSELIGSLLFIGEILLFVWMWRVVKRNSWRWPNMKLTAFSLMCVVVILSFAGVKPLSLYKDAVFDRVSSYLEERQAIREAEEREVEAESVERLENQRLEEEKAVQPSSTQPTIVQPTIVQPTLPQPTITQPALRNPSWSQLLAFLKADDTDKMEYIYPTVVCWDFANRLQKNAKEAGWRCAVVNLDMTGYTDPYNYGIAHDAGHACNAFETTDRGLVYIDCTGLPGNSGAFDHDRIVSAQIGKPYNPEYIFPTGGWYVPRGQMGVVVEMDIRW